MSTEDSKIEPSTFQKVIKCKCLGNKTNVTIYAIVAIGGIVFFALIRPDILPMPHWVMFALNSVWAGTITLGLAIAGVYGIIDYCKKPEVRRQSVLIFLACISILGSIISFAFIPDFWYGEFLNTYYGTDKVAAQAFLDSASCYELKSLLIHTFLDEGYYSYNHNQVSITYFGHEVASRYISYEELEKCDLINFLE